MERLLEAARRNVEVAESLVAQQKAVIERLRSLGHPTAAAEELLALMQEAFHVMNEYLEFLQEIVE